MIPHTRFGKVFDFIGSGALVGAIAALGSLTMLNVPEASAFSVLFTSIAVAVGAFSTARLIEIASVLANHESPRRRRVAHAPAANLSTVPTVTPKEQDSDLPRAA